VSEYAFTETRMGESVEIGVRDAQRSLVAVITHPMPKAKWFVHWANDFRTEKHRTRKDAINAVKKGNPNAQ
jgi:hypothetical protein